MQYTEIQLLRNLTKYYLKQGYPRTQMDNFPDFGVGNPKDFQPSELFLITATIENSR